MALDKTLTQYADTMAEQVLARIQQQVDSGIHRILRSSNGGHKIPTVLKGIKRVMDCRVEGCKERSRGPRYGFICATHGKKLTASQQKAARVTWNQKHKN